MKENIEIPEELKRNISAWYNNTIQEDKFSYLMEKISELQIPDDFVVYIYGVGGQPKQAYKSLLDNKNINVVWYDFILPTLLKPLSFIMAGYAGLVKIYNIKEIKDTFIHLSENSMVGLYIFNKKIETEFIKRVKEKNFDVFKIDRVIWEKDDTFFIYYVDADNNESSTGIYEIVSYGKNCSEGLINLLY